MVHVEPGGPSLRLVLSDARPSWSEKDLAAVEEKLSRVGATTAEKLAELLSSGLNKRLLAAGQKAFNSETLAALRQRLSANDVRRESPRQDKDDCQEPAGQFPTRAQQATKLGEAHEPKISKMAETNKVKMAASEGRPHESQTSESFKDADYAQTTFSPSAPFGRLEALGETPLIKAVRQTDVRTVQYLLEHRSNPNEKDQGRVWMNCVSTQGIKLFADENWKNGPNLKRTTSVKLHSWKLPHKVIHSFAKFCWKTAQTLCTSLQQGFLPKTLHQNMTFFRSLQFR